MGPDLPIEKRTPPACRAFLLGVNLGREMLLQPKNWAVFQHYKDRCPPWIKLHRDLLNDRAYMSLPVASKAIAPLLWLLASESKDGVFDGSPDELVFRLHMTTKEVKDGVKPLIEKGFFTVASGVLAEGKQTAIPETETEGETKKEKETDDGFDEFWRIYDYAKGKPAAKKSWNKLKPSIELQLSIYDAARAYVQSTPDKQFRKHASTWLNAEGWNDEVVVRQEQQKKVGFFGQLAMTGGSNEPAPTPIAIGVDR